MSLTVKGGVSGAVYADPDSSSESVMNSSEAPESLGIRFPELSPPQTLIRPV